MTRVSRVVGGVCGLIGALVSCGGSSSGGGEADCPLGTETCHCRADGSCSGGLSCLSNLCVDAADPSGGSAGERDSGESGGNAGEGTHGGAYGGNASGGSASGGGASGETSSGGSSAIGGEVGGSGTGGRTARGGAGSGGLSATAGAGDGGTGDGGTGDGGTGDGGTGDGGTVTSGGSGSGGALDGCVAASQVVDLAPLNIVIMLDKSGSMGNGSGPAYPQNYELRWAPIKAGMRAFFEGGSTTGVAASLSYFPVGESFDEACSDNYLSPAVPMTALTESAPLVNSLGATEPGGGTPMLSATYGATTYARQLMEDVPGSLSVVLLVTDGEPAMYVTENATTGDLNGDGELTNYIEPDCVPAGLAETSLLNTVEDVCTVVSSAAASDAGVLTYVLGVGPSLDGLGAIATAGGTALILAESTAEPDATAATVTSVLEEIVQKNRGCSVILPDAVDGEPLSPALLNVEFVSADGTVKLLRRSDSCSAEDGWRFDSADAPSRIELCPSACASVRSDSDGELRLVAGCSGVIEPPI